MSRAERERIRDAIREGRYYLTEHANEEMLEDGLDVLDVETSILNGVLRRKESTDPRGTVYTIHGMGTDPDTPVGTAGRFTSLASSEQYRVITVYRRTIEGDER